MAKKNFRKKNTDTVILIRIPDVNARQGEATLTIQRGDLGHMHSFQHTGLSLKSDIAEAVQEALQKLAKIEAAPPPELPAAAATEPDTDSGDNTDTDDTSPPDDADSDENNAEITPNSASDSGSVSSQTDSS